MPNTGDISSEDTSSYDQDELDQHLLEAVNDGDVVQVKYYLKLGADVNATDSSGKSSLHIAAENGNDEIFSLLLESDDADTELEAEDGDMLCDALPVHYAAYYGNANIVNKILQYDDGVTVNALDGCGLSPLHEAIDQDNDHVIKELLKEPEIDINIESSDGEGDLELPVGSSPIIQAIVTNKISILKLLFENKAIYEQIDFFISDELKLDNIVLPEDSNLLHLASLLGSEEIVETLLEFLPADLVNQYNKRSYEDDEDNEYVEPGESTPFQYALRRKDEDIILAYMRSGKMDWDDHWPKHFILHDACKYGWLEVIHELATMDDVDFNAKDLHGNNVIKIAQKHDQIQVIAELSKIMREHPKLDIDPNYYNPNVTFAKMRHSIAEECREELYSMELNELADGPDQFVIDQYIYTFCDPSPSDKDLIYNKRLMEKFKEYEKLGKSSPPELRNEYKEWQNSPPPELIKKYIELIEGSPWIEEFEDFHDDDAFDNADKEENLPPHISAYMSEDPRMVKMLHSLPGLDHGRPLSGMRDPKSFIKSDEMRQLYEQNRRVKRKRKYSELTTIGPSSVGSLVRGRLEQEEALASDVESDMSDYSEDVITELLDQVNEEFCNKRSVSDDTFPFVIPHFRGINFNREIFSSSKQKEEFIKNAREIGLHSKMSHVNAGIPIGKYLAEEEDRRLAHFDRKVNGLWSGILSEKIPMEKYWDKGKGEIKTFKKPKYLMQGRYTGSASKEYEPGKHTDIWPSIWSKVSENPSVKHGIRIGQDLKLEENPLVSFGKTPGHAVRYAVGRSLSGALRSTRGDPFYRNTGKAKHRLIGLVYITLHTVDEYLSAKPSDVTRLQKK